MFSQIYFAIIEAARAIEENKRRTAQYKAYKAERICQYCGTENERDCCPSCGAPQPERKVHLPSYAISSAPPSRDLDDTIGGRKMTVMAQATRDIEEAKRKKRIADEEDEAAARRRRDTDSSYSMPLYTPDTTTYSTPDTSSSDSSYSGGGGSFDGGGASGDY